MHNEKGIECVDCIACGNVSHCSVEQRRSEEESEDVGRILAIVSAGRASREMTEFLAKVCIAFQRLVHFSDVFNMSSEQIQEKDDRQVLERISILRRTGRASDRRMPLVARLLIASCKKSYINPSIAFVGEVLEESIDRLYRRSLGEIHR